MVMKARDRDNGMVGVGKDWWWQRRLGDRRAKQWALAGVCVDSDKGVVGGDDNEGAVGFRQGGMRVRSK